MRSILWPFFNNCQVVFWTCTCTLLASKSNGSVLVKCAPTRNNSLPAHRRGSGCDLSKPCLLATCSGCKARQKDPKVYQRWRFNYAQNHTLAWQLCQHTNVCCEPKHGRVTCAKECSELRHGEAAQKPARNTPHEARMDAHCTPGMRTRTTTASVDVRT